MGKHLPITVKLSYVLRAVIKREPVAKLGSQLVNQGLSNSLGSRPHHGRNKPGIITIYQWIYRLYKYGLWGLGRMSKKRKSGFKRSDYSKDELWDSLELFIEIFKEEGISITKERIEKIKKKWENERKKSCHHGWVSANKFIKLSRTPNSSYYYKHRQIEDDKELEVEIIRIFSDSKQTYGSRRILVELKSQKDKDNSNESKWGTIGRKTVMKIMKKHGLKSIIKKRRRPIDYKNTHVNFPNLINRNFITDIPRHKIFTDTTFIRSPYAKNRFFYLSAYIDTYDNSVFALALSENNDTKLALDSVKQVELNSQTIVHTDHGSVYSSTKFMEHLKKYGAQQSMSRVGNSLDNRPIEFFWSNIKEECINQIPYEQRTYDVVFRKIKEYINWYNHHRRQSCLNQLAPSMVKGSIINYY